jgi:7,8-dihydroneopterin aldolase/epimerase/oxygenase
MGAKRDEDPDELTGADAGSRGDGPDAPGPHGDGLDQPAGARAPREGGGGDELDYLDEPSEPGEAHAPDDDDDEDIDLDDEREETGESVTIEIAGLSLYTHHGVSEAEREVGQRLVFDLRLDLGETDATVTDSIEDTVDYGEVCQLVALIAQQRSHKTLERLCGTIADRLLGDYELEGVWVKATKPEPPIPLSVDEVSVEVWREAEE